MSFSDSRFYTPTGVWVPIRTATLTANSTTYTTDVTGVGADQYMIEHSIIYGGAATALIDLRPNGLTANRFCQLMYLDAGQLPAALGTASVLYIDYEGLHNPIFVGGWCTIEAPIGFTHRRFESRSGGMDSSDVQFSAWSHGFWKDSTTVLTSLTVNSSSNMLIGSKFTTWAKYRS